MLNIKDIQRAVENIKEFVHKTPLIYSNSFSKMTGAEVYLKAENLQKTGSFKVRGAFNVDHDRFTVNLSIGKTRVIFIVETRSKEHLEEILLDITEKGFKVRKRIYS